MTLADQYPSSPPLHPVDLAFRWFALVSLGAAGWVFIVGVIVAGIFWGPR